jgi:hypothetical protein
MNSLPGWKQKPFWIRLMHWEYWSFNLLYLPVYPVYFFLSLRARSFFFFAAANPKIKNGGFLGESKKDIYKIVPEAFQPGTIFFEKGSGSGQVLKQIEAKGFVYPLIGKPDMGARGRGVKKLDDQSALVTYVDHCLVDFIIQEYVPYENESGIFYYRIPGQEQGNISGIVRKEFLKVTGDGKQNVRDLLKKNPRAVLQLTYLEKTEKSLLDLIPGRGKSMTVVPYGNHARGALFIDDSASINPALIRVMDGICSKIPAFHFGRLDIRYESRELLEQGKSFSIIEVNGAGSEPTHIYDPGHSLFFAWKEIIRHLSLLLRISLANHRLGCPYLSVSEGLQMFRDDRKNSELLTRMNKNELKNPEH